jgi:hypothetical protein
MIRHRVGTLLRGVLALAADKVFGPSLNNLQRRAEGKSSH